MPCRPACSSCSPLRVLLVGGSRSVEMLSVIAATAEIFGDGEIHCLPDAALLGNCESDWFPNLVILCQHHPDEFTREDVHDLIRRYPLARWVCCFGAWCESDGRNRDVWPIGVRTPARLARGRLLRERRVLEGRRSPLPLTAGREEAFAFDHADRDPAVSSQLSALREPPAMTATVCSPDRELRRCFEDRLRCAGVRIVQFSADESPQVILFDADPWNAQRAGALCELRSRHVKAEILALMSCARAEELAALTRAGALRVLPKLVAQHELAAALTGRKQHRCHLHA